MLTEWREAVLRHTPPTDQLLESGRYALGPAFGAALAVFALGILTLGRRGALAAGAVAILAGFVAANYFRSSMPWLPDRSDAGTYVGWKWLPVLLLAASFDGLFARTPTVPVWGGWRLRLGVGLLAALLVVPHDLHKDWPLLLDDWPFPVRARVWPLVAFTLAVALGWAGSEAVARQTSRGTVGLGLSAALFGASMVVIHAHFATFADVFSILGAALLAISLVAAVAKVDVGGAIPAVAVALPVGLLVAATETFSEVPWYAFLLAGLPPFTIGLLALPPVSRLGGFWRGVLFWVLCLGPTVAAVTLAVWKESLLVEDSW